jgi:hypothetical protein
MPSNEGLPECPIQPPNLMGSIPVWMEGPGFSKLAELYSDLGEGGHGWPKDCQARHKVALIIPYRFGKYTHFSYVNIYCRDREHHLRIFLHNLHSFLRKQQLDYAIFIIQQVADQTFNRGLLFFYSRKFLLLKVNS